MPPQYASYESVTPGPESAKRALVALGANLPLGDAPPETTLRAAAAALADAGFCDLRLSSFWRTPCFPPGAGPDYVNAALVARVSGDADGVLARLHAIEAAFGRERQVRWGMRTLDLDLIALDDLVLPDAATQAAWQRLSAQDQMRLTPDRLILPHPRLAERAFVLVPLAEIAPDWRHPLTGQSIAAMLAALPSEALQGMTRLDPDPEASPSGRPRR